MLNDCDKGSNDLLGGLAEVLFVALDLRFDNSVFEEEKI